jgi:ABC-2 type transport system permease protein
MWQLLQIEIFKIFRRPRTYIAFGAITAIVLLIQVALKFDGEAYMDLLLNNLKESFVINTELKQKILNGYLICFVILNTLLLQMPLLVALVSGDSVAGEANMGTLRLSLTRPVGRTEYILVKFTASLVYTVILLVWMALLALFGSMLIFGTNDLIVMRSEGIDQMRVYDIMWRYLAAFGYAAVALSVVASLSFLLSVFAENAIGPIIGTMSIIIIFTILSEMNIPIYDETVKPWLFTTHMVAWKGFFYVKTDSEGVTIDGSIQNFPAILRSLAILLSYIILFLGASIWVFRKKDILS